jgi:hypothetical protein
LVQEGGGHAVKASYRFILRRSKAREAMRTGGKPWIMLKPHFWFLSGRNLLLDPADSSDTWLKFLVV